MFRKRYHAITVRRIVEFLILDRDFPRAVRFCLDGAERSLRTITGSPDSVYCNSAEQRGAVASQFVVCGCRALSKPACMNSWMIFNKKLNHIDDAIYDTFWLRTL